MNPTEEKQLKAMEHSFFQARPNGSEPFFARRLMAMDPFYEQTRRAIDLEARGLSRTSTLSADEKELSRSSTLNVDEKGFSRSPTLNGEDGGFSKSSTLNMDDKGFSRTSTLNIDEGEFSRAPTLYSNEKDMSKASILKMESPAIVKKTRRGRRSWTWAIVSQLIGLLWLAPIIALIILNYKNYVIGASIWCPGGSCSAELFSTRAIQQVKKLDTQDHNVMGALQFVSKSLEVWFMFISTSLVYDVAMLLAKRGGGLPVGFLLTHLEFGDIRYLLSPILWTSPIPHPSRSPRLRAITGKLYLFVLLAAFLTVLTNLMGPATAVLVIPSLQWVDTPHIPDLKFNGTGLAEPPSGDEVIPGCTGDQLSAGNYSCSSKVYGPSLDGYAEYVELTQAQYEEDYGTFRLGISQEGAVQFSINISASGNVVWSPNRQSLRQLSYDALAVMSLMGDSKDTKALQWGNDPPPNFNNSLSTILLRESISLGVATGCYTGNVTTTQVDAERGITCYEDWPLADDSSINIDDPDVRLYTMCIRTGSWSDVVVQNEFFVDHSSSSQHQKDPKMRIRTYFSDRATFFNETTDFGTNIKACLEDHSSEECDWDKIFAVELPVDFRNITSNLQVVEYKTSKPKAPNLRVWCTWNTYLGFGVYSYDAANLANPLGITQLNNLSDVGPEDHAQIMHPDWLLAAWSVDNGGTVDGDRPVAKALTKTVSSMFSDDTDGDPTVEFGYLHLYLLSQAASLVNWKYSNVDGTAETPWESGPIFHRYANLHLWAYGFSDSTSRLGVIVALLGIACVLFRLTLAIVFRFRHEHSAVDLIVAALEHKSQGEFAGLEDEIELAKVRFQMVEDDYGKPRFVAERRGPGPLFGKSGNDGFV